MTADVLKQIAKQLVWFRKHLKRGRKPYCVTQLYGTDWRGMAKGLFVVVKRDYYWATKHIPRHRFTWKDIVIIILLVLFLTGHRAHVIPSEPTSRFDYPKTLQALPQTSLEPQSTIEPTYVAPAVTAPTNSAPSSCGDNQYAAYIYQHESGCNTAAINFLGACGIGQALPCSKMGCSLSDYDCQNAYFTNYANSNYGGWYGAYIHWLNFSWW